MKRSLYVLILTSIIMLTLTAFANEITIGQDPIMVTNTGYPTTVGTSCNVITKNYQFRYNVIEHNDNELVDIAVEKAKKWWNNDQTFHTPNIVWIDVQDKIIKGFQDSEYIFLDPNTTDKDLIATAVHETIHLQNPNPQNMIGSNNEKKLVEAIVEGITIDILGEDNLELITLDYVFFEKSDPLYKNKEALYDSYKTGKDEITEIFGQDRQNIIKKFENYEKLD